VASILSDLEQWAFDGFNVDKYSETYELEGYTIEIHVDVVISELLITVSHPAAGVWSQVFSDASGLDAYEIALTMKNSMQYRGELIYENAMECEITDRAIRDAQERIKNYRELAEIWTAA
jgi:hypothetical protein